MAFTLGVSERNIIQQINNSLFLDITVVIGKILMSLNHIRIKGNKL
ncbi:MAG: hypothetical protein R2942_10265 [Ignavibacteria bacterium]